MIDYYIYNPPKSPFEKGDFFLWVMGWQVLHTNDKGDFFWVGYPSLDKGDFFFGGG